MNLPNLLIAGAPKCGTSSLFNWLAAHPEVCGSSPKETFYFVDQDNPLIRPAANYHQHGLDHYTFFPPGCSAQAQFFLEATTHHLYQKTALNFFANRQPQPQIIFVLRKPSARIFSSFNYTQNNLSRLDKDVSFRQFTDLLLEGKLDQIRDRFHSEQSFFTLKHDLLYSQYSDFLLQWAKCFPPERLTILLFEQLKGDPGSILRRLARDLGIAADFYDQFDFTQRNQTMGVKNSFIHRTLRHFAPYFPKSPFKMILKSLYFNTQRDATVAKPDSESLQKLDYYFTPYNQQLAEKFNLNLDCWK